VVCHLEGKKEKEYLPQTSYYAQGTGAKKRGGGREKKV